MKRFVLILILPALLLLHGCGESPGSIDNIGWMIGSWQGTDVNGLVFHESWEREGKSSFSGFGCTVTPEGDTVFRENLKIDLVEETPYYVSTIPGNKGPVLFKMVKGDAHSAIFENKEHDFPQRISYLLETNTTMKVRLEGISKGEPKIETLQFERAKAEDLNMDRGSKKDPAAHVIQNDSVKIQLGQ